MSGVKGASRDKSYVPLGEFIARRRLALGMATMGQLENRLLDHNPKLGSKAAVARISDWENGVHRPRPDVAIDLLAVLKIAKGSDEAERWERLYNGGALEDRIARAEQDRVEARYLRWLVEQYSRLDLYGLHGGDRRGDIELEQVFVALRGGLANPYESPGAPVSMEEAEDWATLHSGASLDPLETPQARASHPAAPAIDLPIAVEERDMPHLFGGPGPQVLPLGEVFRREPRLVILGDPGSGKTTLLRWICLMLARAAQNPKTSGRVIVPNCNVDPDADETDQTPFDLGPVRLPVLVRIAGYMEARARAGGILPFLDYLGAHLSPGPVQPATTTNGESLDPEALNTLFRAAIADRRAVILLDGLDEIATPEDRAPIAAEIERFLDGQLFDGPSSRRTALGTEGNQVVVTSRIVGYQLAGLGPRASHMTLEPMSARAVSRYCRLYSRERARVIRGPERWSAAALADAEREGDQIAEEVRLLRARDAADLASTPLLLTILIMVARPGGRLPERRAILYREAVEKILATWRDRVRRTGSSQLPDAERLNLYLRELASYLQTHSGLGLVDRDHARFVLKDLGPADEISDFIDCATQEVGLLTARGAGTVGFQHQTFQEYFAALWLTSADDQTVQRIQERSASPRWREPILLALGVLSLVERGPGTESSIFAKLLDALGDAPQLAPDILPADFLLVCGSLGELNWIPPQSIRQLSRHLIERRREAGSRGPQPLLQRQIDYAARGLADPRGRPMLQDELRRAIAQGAGQASDRAWAAASLLQPVGLFDRDIVAALDRALPHDSATWGWPIDVALRDAAGQDPLLLRNSGRSLREILGRSDDLASRFLADPAGRRLCWLLYGGPDMALYRRFAQDQSVIERLNREQADVDRRGESPEKQALQDDVRRRRDETNQRLKASRSAGPDLAVGRIHRDVPRVTAVLVDALTKGEALETVCDRFKPDVFNTQLSRSERVDQAMAVLATMKDNLEPFIDDVVASGLGEDLLAAMGRGHESRSLGVAGMRSASLAQIGPLIAELPPAQALRIFSSLLHLCIHDGGGPFSVADLASTTPESVRPRALAEMWQYLLSGYNDDVVYNLAVSLDTLGSVLERAKELALSLAELGVTANGAMARHSGWMRDLAPPVARNDRQLLAITLDAVSSIPAQGGFVGGWIIACLGTYLVAMGFAEESLAIAQTSVPETFGARTMALSALQAAPPDGAGDNALASLRRAALGIGKWPAFLSHLGVTEDTATNAGSIDNAAVEAITRSLDDMVAAATAPGFIEATGPILEENQEIFAFDVALGIEAMLRAQGSEKLDARLLLANLTALNASRDIENRCRQLARLAGIVWPELAKTFLSCALAQIPAIADFDRRSETLRLLWPSLLGFGDLEALAARYSDELPFPQRQSALGRLWGLIAQCAAGLGSAGVDVAPLLAAALTRDAAQILGHRAGVKLTVHAPAPTHAPSGVTGLQTRIGGALLDRAVARRLEAERMAEPAVDFEKLLARSGAAAPEALPLIRLWRETHPAVRNMCALLRAEVVDLEPEAIGPLLELLDASDDLSRCRAAIALYGYQDAFRRVSRLGAPVIEEVARWMRRFKSPAGFDARRGLALVWTLETVRHDSPSAIRRWVDQVANELDPDGAELADLILRNVMAATQSALDELLLCLREGSPRAKAAVLHSLSLMAARSLIPDRAWVEITEIVDELPEEIRTGSAYVSDLSALSQAVVDGIDCPALRPVLPTGPLDAAAVKRHLSAAGDTHVYGVSYVTRIRAAVDALHLNQQTYLSLVNKLIEELQRPSEYGQRRATLLTSELLDITAAAVERSPNTFYQAVGMPTREGRSGPTASIRERLEAVLTQSVRYHYTFTGRASAMLMLSHLRWLTADVCEALASALDDVPHVQSVALACARRFRFATPAAMESLLAGLADSATTPLTRLLHAHLLLSLAGNGHLDSHLEGDVIAAIVEAAQNSAGRPVYMLLPPIAGGTHSFSVLTLGNLDQVLLSVLAGAIDLDLLTAGNRALEMNL